MAVRLILAAYRNSKGKQLMTTMTNIHHITKLTTSSVPGGSIIINFETDYGGHGSVTFFPSKLTNKTELLQLLKQDIDCDLEIA